MTLFHATSRSLAIACACHRRIRLWHMVDPSFFPKGAVLEQVDVTQLGKSVNFCIAPFDGAPHCRIGDDRSVFASKDQAKQLSYDLCRVLRDKIGNCRGSAFRCDDGGWVDIDAVISDRNNDIFPRRLRKQDATWPSWK